MAKFIQIIDTDNKKRLINVDHISDIYENFIYLDSLKETGQVTIRTSHNYETLIMKLQHAHVEVIIE